MPEIGASGSMSGEGNRSDATWPKPPRPSSTLLAMPVFGSHPLHQMQKFAIPEQEQIHEIDRNVRFTHWGFGTSHLHVVIPCSTEKLGHPIDMCADGCGGQEKPSHVEQSQKEDDEAEIGPRHFTQNEDSPLLHPPGHGGFLMVGSPHRIISLAEFSPKPKIHIDADKIVDTRARSSNRPSHNHRYCPFSWATPHPRHAKNPAWTTQSTKVSYFSPNSEH